MLKYLVDAGLLGDVSALVARARAQDEANMRKIESRANGKQYSRNGNAANAQQLNRKDNFLY